MRMIQLLVKSNLTFGTSGEGDLQVWADITDMSDARLAELRKMYPEEKYRVIEIKEAANDYSMESRRRW